MEVRIYRWHVDFHLRFMKWQWPGAVDIWSNIIAMVLTFSYTSLLFIIFFEGYEQAMDA